MSRQWKDVSTETKKEHAAGVNRHRIPTEPEIMTVLCASPDGMTAAKIADVITATVGNVLYTLRMLKNDGHVICDDVDPQAWSKWRRKNNNPRSVAIVRSTS